MSSPGPSLQIMMVDKLITWDLPTYSNAFIGRSHHLSALRDLLIDRSKRLVTLLGPGGIGKTRLAVELGQKLGNDFEHGVRFVGLEAAIDEGEMLRKLGQQLKLKPPFSGSWMEVIIPYLLEKEMLLILDNLEQLPDAAKVVDALLESCPALTVLATSRSTLGLRQETEYPLDSLQRPGPNRIPEPPELLEYEAVALFVQKARETAPAFTLNRGNAKPVMEICQHLEGIPLPLELAAARIKLFDPETLNKHLVSNASVLLQDKIKRGTARHQTIQNSIIWSYNLLSPEMQQHFQRLALFKGGFTLDALQNIFSDDDPISLVESVVNKSLVQKHHLSGRFRMLNLIRDFGLEKLAENPDREVFCEAFSEYFFQLAARKRQGINENIKWLGHMEEEYENVQVALHWLQLHIPEKAGSMAASLWPYHLNRGLLKEGLDMLSALIGLPGINKQTLARLYEGAGNLSHNLGRNIHARQYFQESLKLCQELDLPNEIARGKNNLSWAEWRLGNYGQTIALAEAARKAFLQNQNLKGLAKALNNISWGLFYQGHFEKAEDLQRQILSIHSRHGHTRGIAFARTNLARSLIHLGKFLEAGSLIEDAIQVYDMLGNKQLSAFSRMVKSECFLEKGDIEAAEGLLQDACLPTFDQIGDTWGIASTHLLLARIDMAHANGKRPEDRLVKALELSRNSHDPYGEAYANLLLGRLSFSLGQQRGAEEYLTQAVILSCQMEARVILKECCLVLGLKNADRGAFLLATGYFGMADRLAREMGAYIYARTRQEILPCIRKFHEKLDPPPPDLNVFFSQIRKFDWPEAFRISLSEKEILFRASRLLAAVASPDSESIEGKKANQGIEEEEFLDPAIEEIQRVIKTQAFDPNFTVEGLCQNLNMSYSQVHRRTKSQLQATPSKLIHQARLYKAKDLLRNTNETVATVAYDSGFRDPDYFHRVFKKALSMTPGEYRKLNRS